jgi:hypothetical protein
MGVPKYKQTKTELDVAINKSIGTSKPFAKTMST